MFKHAILSWCSLLVKLLFKNTESASLILHSYQTARGVKSGKGADDSYKKEGYDKEVAVQDVYPLTNYL